MDSINTSGYQNIEDDEETEPSNVTMEESENYDEEIAPSNDVTIEESENGSVDESILKIRRKKNRAVIESDDDDDDDDDSDGNDFRGSNRVVETDDEDDNDNDGRALSPCTRMSITGIRPADLTDESSEIDYSDSEDDNIKDINSEKKNSSSENDWKSANSTMTDANVSPTDAEKQNRASTPAESRKTMSTSSTSPSVEEFSGAANNIALDCSPKLATINQSHRTALNASSDDSDVVIINKSEDILEISSSDDESTLNKIPLKLTPEKKPKVVRHLVQPKISTAVANMSVPFKKTPARKILPKQYVSKEFYDKEEKKLDDLRYDLQNTEQLLAKISKTLPDGGRQLMLRIERLRTDIEIKASYLVSLVVEDENVQPFSHPEIKKPFFDKEPLGWDELSAAVNQVQPIHTGRKGMETFQNEKALTVDLLKNLHSTLETCPTEDDMADDPKGLKVQLMNHQKHALKWMTWRESQKPPGGILADDMGLGKTLSMISLVLEDKNRQQEKSESESDSEDDDSHGWTSKGKRNYYQGNTLVVCPASLLHQWESEVKTKVSRHKLSVCVHHGPNRTTKAKHLRNYDMVVTTYAIITSEKKTCGALYGIKWRRIILDEAHVIRNHKAQSSEAACELRGKYRWTLTGTPVQNREMDLYAILKFLRCSPFDNLPHWKRWVDNKSAGGKQRLNTVMKSLLLRRTKVQLQEQGGLDCLPEKQTCVIEVELDRDEMNVYQKIMAYSRSLFAQFLFQRADRNTDLAYSDNGNRPRLLNAKEPNDAYYKIHQKFARMHRGNRDVKSHEILVLLLRLRQICCHPGLIDSMLEDANEDSQNINSEPEDTSSEIDLLDELQKLSIDDEHNLSQEEQEYSKASKASAKVLQRSNPVFSFDRPSSKMKKVIETLEKNILNTNDKAIIVSQWPGVLNILKVHLGLRGVKTLSLNGTIAVKDRQQIVDEFNDVNSNKRILLLSLTAGGVGLNLIGANHLLIIDLHWNPQLEAQAQDRIYRVGQKKPCKIYKLMCKDTIEERIKTLQDHKLAIANGILTGAKAESSKLSIDDLRSLFGI